MQADQATALEAVAAAVAARVPVLLWGAPGTGKSSAVRDLAHAMSWPCEVVIASIREPSDFAGLPVVHDGHVHFAPPRWARRLADVGHGILFLDEISTAPPAVQAALLRVVLERGISCARERPAGEAVLSDKATTAMEQAMRQARGNLRSYAPLTVECWKAVPGAAPLLDGQLRSTHGWVSFALPLRWLNQVWMRGLARVDGYFVLDVDMPAPARVLQAHVVRWERQLGGHRKPVAVSCMIHRQSGEWHIAW
jgi:AAA domain (dynein-related subfamily)